MGVDADRAEEGFHAESACFVRHDGHDIAAQVRVLEQFAQQVNHGHGGGHFPLAGALHEFDVHVLARRAVHRHRHAARGQQTAQGPPALPQILHLLTVLGRPVEGHLGDLVIRDGDAETAAEMAQLLLVELLLLVGDVAPLASLPQAVALDGFGQNHGGGALVGHRGVIGGIDFLGIVAAAPQFVELLVGVAGHQFGQLGIFAEEVLANVIAPGHGVLLILAVGDLVHALHQPSAGVPGEQRIPVVPPDNLEHMPAGPPESGLQLLDDLAVAPHRAVQTLEIAIDHEGQIVQLLPGGQGDGPQGFGLIQFAVA